MAIDFSSITGLHEKALSLRAERAQQISNNLANADTPNFKARDLDFRAVLTEQQGLNNHKPLALEGDHQEHFNWLDHQSPWELQYRIPSQPSIDGNTVDEHVEHREFLQNAMSYQASLTFLEKKFSGLKSALRGE